MKRTEIQEFDPTRVQPFPGQPRQRFRGILELAKSMRLIGQITPGKVTLCPADNRRYDARLIDGERRLQACKLSGIPFRAEVHEGAGDDEHQFEISLAANFGKQDHDCIEIAHALSRLQKSGRSVNQIADICGGKSDCWVYQHLSLLRLHPDVQKMLIPSDDPDAVRLAFTTAVQLADKPHAFQLKLAKRIINGRLTGIQTRRLIMGEARAAGIKPSAKNRFPLDNFRSLHKLTQKTTDHFGIFLDMDGRELKAVVQAGPAHDRDEIAYDLRELASSLMALADVVDLAPKKGDPNHAGRAGT